MELNVEEREHLAALTQSELWRPLLKAIDILVTNQGNRVLTCPDAETESEKRKLQGMQSLRLGIENFKKDFKSGK